MSFCYRSSVISLSPIQGCARVESGVFSMEMQLESPNEFRTHAGVSPLRITIQRGMRSPYGILFHRRLVCAATSHGGLASMVWFWPASPLGRHGLRIYCGLGTHFLQLVWHELSPTPPDCQGGLGACGSSAISAAAEHAVFRVCRHGVLRSYLESYFRYFPRARSTVRLESAGTCFRRNTKVFRAISGDAQGRGIHE